MRLAGIVLGLGLGGFVDGIALHQIMQWHNMGSAVTERTPHLRNVTRCGDCYGRTSPCTPQVKARTV